MSDDPSTAMFGPYRAVRRLGKGMQAETFLADAPQGGQVVIKVFSTDHPHDRRSMDTEVAALRVVAPTFAPRVLAFMPAGDRPCFVMEYLDGETVDDLLANGPLDEDGTRRLGIGLAALLAGIHDAGVAHCDFRGQNLILVRGGLFAVDFGWARLRTDSLAEFRRGRQLDLLRLGVLIARAGTGRAPIGEDQIEDFEEGNLDLGPMSGTLRAEARALLSSRAWRRPSARAVHSKLLRG